jgi:hypothetical protein
MQNIEKVLEFVEKWDLSSLGRTLAVIVSLAESAQRLNGPVDPQAVAPVDDRLLTPQDAAKYCGISWATLRDHWVERYGIKSSGEGRGRRFRVSELQRVIRERENRG